MNKSLIIGCIATISVAILIAMPAAADSFTFSTGNPDGLIATLSRVASAGKLETETADDFVTTQATVINSATFTGLLPSGTPLSAVSQVEVELYHVFPIDSTDPPDGRVITRVNSPSDNNFDARDSNVPGQLSFTTKLLNPSFTASNSVVNGIHPTPNQFTGGEGAVTGEEVQFNLTFAIPFTVVGADHIFFRPEVGLTSGDFLWLSAPKPIVSPGTPFAADLESWIRNDGTGALAPDWERIGTDVTHQGPFNAAFSMSGETVPQPVPEPSTLLLLGTGLSMLVGWRPKQWIPRETRTRKNCRVATRCGLSGSCSFVAQECELDI
jgi:hypothetical protein